MRRIKEYVGYVIGWTGRLTRAELASLAAGAVVLAVVPGALVAWLAWRLLRTRSAS